MRVYNPPPKEQKVGENFCKKNSFQVGMDLIKGQKQGRDERAQEHYPNTK